jgi:hypothetical protein
MLTIDPSRASIYSTLCYIYHESNVVLVVQIARSCDSTCIPRYLYPNPSAIGKIWPCDSFKLYYVIVLYVSKFCRMASALIRAVLLLAGNLSGMYLTTTDGTLYVRIQGHRVYVIFQGTHG